MSLNDAIDQYCERLSPDFWAEPLNAWSNVAFVLVGLWLWRRGRHDRGLSVLGILIAIIGVGSGLFHTYATGWAKIADVAPIGITLIYCLWLYQRRVFQLSRGRTALGLVAFGAVTGAFAAIFPAIGFDIFNESQTYFPCLLVLLLFSWCASGLARRLLALAATAFGLALICRIVDLSLCEAWSPGTHFLWHLLNAVTLLLVGLVLLKQEADPR